jgi:hypothetical protein
MVKSNSFFSSNYKQSEKTEETVRKKILEKGIDIISFDINSEFEKCNEKCPIKVDHFGNSIPYARWVLYNNISRPDFVLKINGKPLLLEIKHKNKKYLWVNERDYIDYIKWQQVLLIDTYILFYVKSEDKYYLHKIVTNIENLKSFRTKHDNNMVFDVEDLSPVLVNFDEFFDVINKTIK